MTTNERQACMTEIPRLRLFLGEEAGEPDDRRPPDPIRRLREQWVRSEGFWAGRNHAARRSTRIAA